MSGRVQGWNYFICGLNKSYWWLVHTSPHVVCTYTCIIQIRASFCMALREYPSLLPLVMLFSHNITQFNTLKLDLMLILLLYIPDSIYSLDITRNGGHLVYVVLGYLSGFLSNLQQECCKSIILFVCHPNLNISNLLLYRIHNSCELH